MRKIIKKILVGFLLTMLIIGTVTSVNAYKNTKIDKTIKEKNIGKIGSNDIDTIGINPVLRGTLIANFENTVDGFNIEASHAYVSGKIGSGLKVWSTGGNGIGGAYKGVGYFSEGFTIFFYGKGYVAAFLWDGSVRSHIVDIETGCGTTTKIWNDCNNGQPYSNWRLFKVVADTSSGGNLYLRNAGGVEGGYIGENYAGYYDYAANIWIVPQPKDLWEFIWPGPPASITNLKNVTYQKTYIKWIWTDPNTPDFSKVQIYINGKYKSDVVKGKQYYNSTGLLPNTLYTISTHTVDTYGNVNNNWINKTARTAR